MIVRKVVIFSPLYEAYPSVGVYNIVLVCGTLIGWELAAIHVSCKSYIYCVRVTIDST